MTDVVLLLFLGLLFSVTTYVIVNNILSVLNRKFLFERHDKIFAIFDRARETAYQKIFRENVLVYVSSGVKLDQDNVTKLQNEYITVVTTYCGNSIMDDLIDIYGNFDSLVAYLASDLLIRIENDEVIMTKFSQDKNIMGIDNAE